jgi:hypothetical protein
MADELVYMHADTESERDAILKSVFISRTQQDELTRFI